LGAADAEARKIELDSSLLAIESSWVDVIAIEKPKFATEQSGAARPPHWGYHGEYRWPRADERRSTKRGLAQGGVQLLDVYTMQGVSNNKLTWVVAAVSRNGIRLSYSVTFNDEKLLKGSERCPFDP
jgi:hypothetical protein